GTARRSALAHSHVSVHLELRDHLRSCGSQGLCGVDIMFDHPNISEANEITGSQLGSQRQQIQGYARPLSATISAATEHVRPHLESSGDRPQMPSKQRVAGSNPARRTRSSPSSDLDRPSLGAKRITRYGWSTAGVLVPPEGPPDGPGEL